MIARLVFVVLMLSGFVSQRDTFDLEGRYADFESERGAKANQTAQAIVDSLGLEMVFDADADKDEVKAELLKAILIYCSEEGDLVRTVSFGKAAIDFYRGHGSLMDLAGTYMTLGNVYQMMGNYDEAVRSYNTCSDIMDEIGGPMAKVNKRYVLNNMAAMYLEMGEFDLAEEMWNRCIASVSEVDPGFLPQYSQDSLRSLDLATYYQNLAEVRLAQSELADDEDATRLQRVEEAIRFLEQSLDFSERYGAEQGKVVGRLMALSKAYFEAGHNEQAERKMDTALLMAQANDDRYLLAALHLLKGDMELKSGRVEVAENQYFTALSIARENHFGELEMDALLGAYECTKDRKPQAALAYFTEHAALKDSIFNKEQQALVRDFEVRYKMEEKEHELALQQEKNRQSNRLLVLSLVAVVLLLGLLLVGLYVLLSRKRRNALKDHLLFIVSHDIKMPVVTQAQLSEMTYEHLDDMTQDEIRENLQVLKVSSDDLRDKMQNIVYWVKGEMGGYQPRPALFDLRKVTQEVVRELSLQTKSKGLTIVNEVPEGWQALDDEGVFRVVLQNLLTNAVKFSWPNGEIRIISTDEGGRYWLSVSDKGLGISEEKMKRLLKGFAQFAEGTQGEMGTGIGLFVSQQLLQRKGGQLKMESTQGEGTTVSFTVNKAKGNG